MQAAQRSADRSPEASLAAPPAPQPAHPDRLPWASWDEVPAEPPAWATRLGFFVELFAGRAGYTAACHTAGLFALPPVELDVSAWVTASADCFSDAVLPKLRSWIRAGAVRLAHFGTPGSVYLSGERGGSGPESLPIQDSPLLVLACELIRMLTVAGSAWTLVAPSRSPLWSAASVKALAHLAPLFHTFLDQCSFGSASKKSTLFVSNRAHFQRLSRHCDGSHRHKEFCSHGRPRVEWCRASRSWLTAAKLARVHPADLCYSYALAARSCFVPSGPVQPPVPLAPPSASALSRTFALRTPPEDRKRPLGQPVSWEGHPQEVSARRALSSGYQLRRTCHPPLLTEELEPGEAVRQLLGLEHPLCKSPALDPELLRNLHRLVADPAQVNRLRGARLAYWKSRALALRPKALAEIRQVSDPLLRRLFFQGVDDPGDAAPIGSFVHFPLWRELATIAKVTDFDYIEQFKCGLPIVGPVVPSGRWPAVHTEPELTFEELDQRAREIRDSSYRKVLESKRSDGDKAVWESSIADTKIGAAVGPFYDPEQVTKALGSDNWLAAPRFPIEQKNKFRGIDDFLFALVNAASCMSEKLELSSTDEVVSIIRELEKAFREFEAKGHPVSGLAAWVLDEKDAYRQIPVRPDQRRFSVVVAKDPSTGSPAFFIMVAHSFGLLNAVYNYNRRSAMLDEIMVKIFLMVSRFFYDDKFGLEVESTLDSALDVARGLHQMLGVRFDEAKIYPNSSSKEPPGSRGKLPVILGVAYDLKALLVGLKPSRKQDLLDEIEQILSDKVLGPRQAARLRGRLEFASSHFWGRFGRAFLRAITERQYSKIPRSVTNDAIELALAQWQRLLASGRLRSLRSPDSTQVDCVVLTDGYAPDPRSGAQDPCRIGAACFSADGSAPLALSCPIDQVLIDRWLPRKHQICMVEAFAPVAALATFARVLRGKRIIMGIDADAVLSAFVKGYSDREDILLLVEVLWDTACELDVTLYLERIPTDSNCSDGLSRGQLRKLVACGWEVVRALFPMRAL